MTENQKEPESEKLNKIVYIDYSRRASESDLQNLDLRQAKTSRILTSKGYYRVGQICAIRNF